MKIASLSIAVLLGASLLSACSKAEDRVTFDGQFFRAKLSKVDKQRDQFSIEVSPVSASLDGARDAGRYEATRYCIKNYGTSVVIWAMGLDAEDGTLRVENDKLQLRGACNP